MLMINDAGNLSGLGTASFSDVPNDSNIAAAVEWMKARGITNGCGDGKYCPDDSVTRAQMALFLYRFGGAPILSGSTGATTTDTTDTTSSDIQALIKKNYLYIGGALLALVLLGGRR